MKAVIDAKFGPPDVLQLKEVRKPAPKDNKVLIKATTVVKEDPDMWASPGFNGFLKPRPPSPNRLAISTWAIMLAVSTLPNILSVELFGADTLWLFWAKLILLALLFVVTFVWKAIRPLRHFMVIMLAIYISEELVFRLTGSSLWQSWFGGVNVPFTTGMSGTQLGRLIVSLLMIVTLIALGYRRADFFLARGKLNARIEPVRWLGFSKPEPWTHFGGQFAIYISLGLLVFLIVGGRPNWASFVQVAPMFPVVLLFATMNAFNEEMTYRSSLIAGLEKVVGSKHALWNAALFFGIGHYFGVPYGITGVIMATFLGWLLGKAMIETRGFFWAWFIHFLQDVLIFSFMAVGSITPGG